ncbi:hypothetical protein EJ04DRAFT_563697 [Polyplosphaeria fusca]|uniref:Uncharacterized protein n=1 Tax=Polyplosphaeria fusca TaxID=682080 RepID=A0A9P4R1K1_9PLEO|nr:hypothetical protein EJ04DRAFT_563697 [Polyplosphaeria fusca]
MGLLSLLPDQYSTLETWLKRTFLVLAIIVIGPWAVLLLYDLLLYMFRSATYEIPYVGGRARGRARPRAPSLTERPSGHRRKFSLSRRRPARAETTGGSKSEAADPRWRNIKEEGTEDSSDTR